MANYDILPPTDRARETVLKYQHAGHLVHLRELKHTATGNWSFVTYPPQRPLPLKNTRRRVFLSLDALFSLQT